MFYASYNRENAIHDTYLGFIVCTYFHERQSNICDLETLSTGKNSESFTIVMKAVETQTDWLVDGAGAINTPIKQTCAQRLT